MDPLVSLPPVLESPPRPRILLVDDEVRNLEVLEAILYSHDYDLVSAPTAERALMLLLDGDFAVIVLDVQMPGMSGIELASLIKQRKRTQHIPIIFLTAYFQEDKDVLEGYGSGAVDYLTKPFNPQILRSKIGVFVDLFQKTRALAAANRALEQEVAQRQLAEEALREANNELESRVQARTADLSRANNELLTRERALSESESRVQRELAEQKRIEAALRASETQLRLVTDHAPVFLAQCDRQHRFKFVNRPYAQHFGLRPEDLLGRTLREVLGSIAYEALRPYVEAALRGERIEFEIELPFSVRGSRWIYGVHEPEHSVEGDIVGFVAVITDITERKLAEQEMALARDRALAASRAKDDFLARLSHELRTPLNPVLLLASDAANNPDLPPSVRADFEMIAANVTLEARLIDDLLDLTRIARGKMVLETRPSDVHAAVRGAAQMIQADATQKQLEIELQLDAQPSLILGDDVRLKQVFWNLLQNAVKFTPAGGRIRVESTAEPEAAMLCIRIQDTGIGMTPAELERVFRPFEQGDHAAQWSSQRFGGLGLGLAIARMLVELHSGEIRAASDGPDTGTAFTIRLPLLMTPTETVRPAPVTPSSAVSAKAPPSAAETRARILLVEDHTPTRLALANLLIRRQCEVVTASDAAAARTLITGGVFDLLISDIGLPDGNGCDLMMEFGSRYGVRGIALTGYGSQEDILRSERAGFATHLTKPVSMQALDSALVTVLATREAGAEAAANGSSLPRIIEPNGLAATTPRVPNGAAPGDPSPV